MMMMTILHCSGEWVGARAYVSECEASGLEQVVYQCSTKITITIIIILLIVITFRIIAIIAKTINMRERSKTSRQATEALSFSHED